MYEMRRSLLSSLVVLLVGACGGDGGSGVPGSKQLKDLSADEVMAECTWGVATLGGAGHTTMCTGRTAVTPTVAECVTELNGYKAGCAATVAQLEACTEVLAADPCSFSPCAALASCHLLPEF
jgi:hypothetical protein